MAMVQNPRIFAGNNAIKMIEIHVDVSIFSLVRRNFFQTNKCFWDFKNLQHHDHFLS